MKLKLKLEYSDKTSCFELELFFQAALEIFLWGLRQRWRYLGGALNLVLCVSKKIVTIRRTNLNICQEKWKKLRFWKMKLRFELEYSDKTSCFELELFFKDSRKFSMRSTTTFKVSGKVLRHRAIQRTSNHGHTTRRSVANLFYIYLLVCFVAIPTSQNNHVHIVFYFCTQLCALILYDGCQWIIWLIQIFYLVRIIFQNFFNWKTNFDVMHVFFPCGFL